MLDEVHGEVLRDFPGEVLDDRIIEWCDGPRMRLVRTPDETHLALWNDAQDGVERWIYIRVPPETLRLLLAGKMTILEALQNPEDGTLVVQDDNARGHTRAVRTTLEQIDPASWPLPQATLGEAVRLETE